MRDGVAKALESFIPSGAERDGNKCNRGTQRLQEWKLDFGGVLGAMGARIFFERRAFWPRRILLSLLTQQRKKLRLTPYALANCISLNHRLPLSSTWMAGPTHR